MQFLTTRRLSLDLDIPISGSLDDPEFSAFPIVLKILMNTLWKIVTSPFALLGSHFGGGGEDLQYVLFEPGIDSLAADRQPKLQAPGKGPTDHPALELEVKDASSPLEDRKALAEAAGLSKVRPGGTGGFTEKDRSRILEVYRNTVTEDPAGLLGEGVGSEEVLDSLRVILARQRLTDSVRILDNDLRALAQRRAAAVMAYICQRGGDRLCEGVRSWKWIRARMQSEAASGRH